MSLCKYENRFDGDHRASLSTTMRVITSFPLKAFHYGFEGVTIASSIIHNVASLNSLSLAEVIQQSVHKFLRLPAGTTNALSDDHLLDSPKSIAVISCIIGCNQTIPSFSRLVDTLSRMSSSPYISAQTRICTMLLTTEMCAIWPELRQSNAHDLSQLFGEHAQACLLSLSSELDTLFSHNFAKRKHNEEKANDCIEKEVTYCAMQCLKVFIPYCETVAITSGYLVDLQTRTFQVLRGMLTNTSLSNDQTDSETMLQVGMLLGVLDAVVVDVNNLGLTREDSIQPKSERNVILAIDLDELFQQLCSISLRKPSNADSEIVLFVNDESLSIVWNRFISLSEQQRWRVLTSALRSIALCSPTSSQFSSFIVLLPQVIESMLQGLQIATEDVICFALDALYCLIDVFVVNHSFQPAKSANADFLPDSSLKDIENLLRTAWQSIHECRHRTDEMISKFVVAALHPKLFGYSELHSNGMLLKESFLMMVC